MELDERELRERAEYRRLVDEEFERKRKTGFKDAAEALQAFRDLFESDEEMEEFMARIRADREHPMNRA
jgi:predicted Rdx family selenoprotein